MKHCVAAVAVSLAVGLAGCDDTSPAPSGTAPQDPVNATEVQDTSAVPTPASSTLPVEQPPREALAHAPDFVALFPDAEVTSPEGQNHQISFLTQADPDTVIDFYKKKAEASGLRPTAAMNQGAARAYGAASHGSGGHSLEVVAAPTEDGKTSVQLSWKN